MASFTKVFYCYNNNSLLFYIVIFEKLEPWLLIKKTIKAINTKSNENLLYFSHFYKNLIKNETCLFLQVIIRESFCSPIFQIINSGY